MHGTTCKYGHDSDRNSLGRCRACISIRQKAWRDKNPVKNLHNIQKSSWKFYGVKNFTPLDYDRLYQIQQGKCAICGRHQSEFKRRLSVDHNHKTGKVRGLLCGHCNLRLELVEDEDFMLASYKYLTKEDTFCE